jgi:Tfp pilus assembly protein PilF
VLGSQAATNGENSAVTYKLFKEALEHDPTHSTNIGNYALFVHKSKSGAVQVADELFQRAIQAHAVQPRNLANYATFLWKTHAEPLRIEQYFERAVDADPASASALVQYAAYQQEKGNIMQGKRSVVGT